MQRLLTRCPACSTWFQVVPDQLRVSQGWVKCGVCQDIFDANDALTEADVLDAPTGEPLTGPLETRPTPDESLALAQAAAEDAAALDAGLASGLVLPLIAETPIDVSPVPTVPAVSEAGADEAADAGPTQAFVPWAPPASNGGRWVWLVAIALGLVALAIQVVWFERHALAAHPTTRPLVQRVCASLGCTVTAQRVPEVLVLEGVGMVRAATGQLNLSATLHNGSDRYVAVPALELVLDDTRGTLLTRKTILASEWLPGVTELAPNADQRVALALTWSGAQPAEQGVEYRLLAYYP